MTDAEFLLDVLQDGEPHSQAEILRLSFERRGHGLTIHSRAASLRTQGHFIDCRRVPGKTRGEAWTYQWLGSLEQPSQSVGSLSVDGDTQEAPADGREGYSSETLFDLRKTPEWA